MKDTFSPRDWTNLTDDEFMRISEMSRDELIELTRWMTDTERHRFSMQLGEHGEKLQREARLLLAEARNRGLGGTA